jgi:hypothetical protein
MSNYITNGQMNRNDWEFEYTASRLAAAAMAQRDFRAARVKVWEQKKEEVMKRIKDSGLTVHEDIAAGMIGTASNNFNKYSTSVHNGPQVLVDPTMQKDLNECHMKINEHRNLQKEYDAWLQVLDANPESRLHLKHDDWMFFFGK